jgi:hypothetical protein
MRISSIPIVAMLIAMLLGACSGRKQLPFSQTNTATKEESNNQENQLIVEASSTLANYCELESSQRYEMLYGLISEHRKKSLEKFQVRNAAQYKAFRDSSEARWSEFAVDKKSLNRSGTVSIDGHAKIEESGEVESVSFRARLIKENGSWKVDEWKY